MKKLLLSISFLFLSASILLAQNPRAYIQITPVSPGVKTAYGLPSTAMNASGLRVVPKGSYAYFMPGNSVSSGNADSLIVRSANWELITKPSGSTAGLATFNTLGAKFLADLTGEYQIKVTITTYRGSDDTTIKVYASTFLGVGGFQGVAGSGLNCKMCHTGGNNFPGGVDYITNWSTSMHATALMRKINGSEAPTFANRCISCHATGYDTNATANNNGFDDIARAANYTFWGPGSPAKWDSLKNQYPGLVNHATIGCESCHGAGSEHAMGGNKAKIQISAQDGACAICHDAPTKHYKFSQYENSTHAVAVYEGSATRTMATTTLQDCMRCHDGRGFIAFSKGKTITTPVAPTIADHTTINCATCHDPHGNARPYNLRGTPAVADTFGDGSAYPATISDEARTCANCHKARRGAEVYGITKPTSSTWGPHHSSQLDVLFGRNAAEFTAGYTYQSGFHSMVVPKQCVSCHMAPTDTSAANKNKVGGHTFKLRNPDNNFQATDSACASCHGHRASFNDFIATSDYDGNGVKEAATKEITGLLKLLRFQFPPKGWKDVVDVTKFTGQDSLLYRKAYWNHQLIVEDQSNGLHNTMFAVDVLQKSIAALKSSGATTISSANYSAGWNLISAPLNCASMLRSVLFPTANSALYGYNNGYVTVDTLIAGTGYWLRFPAAQAINYTGTVVTSRSIQAKQGWNLIGPFENTTLASGIKTIPTNIINSVFYGYANGYTNAQILEPGKCYWVRVSGNGTILLPTGPAKTVLTTPEAYEYLTITDRNGIESKAYYYQPNSKTSMLSPAPPMPPAGVPDVRFSSGMFAEKLSVEGKQLEISSMELPVVIKATSDLTITDALTGQLLRAQLKKGESLKLTEPWAMKILVSAGILPLEFALKQNYPNPFNPSTTIEFAVPAKERVKLTIYNGLGQQVATLVDEVKEIGNYSMQWNAANLSSGIYYCRMDAGKFRSVKKFVLIK